MSFDEKRISVPEGVSQANSGRPADSISLLVSNQDASFKDFLRIYKESIAVRERKTEAEISAMLARPDYRVLLLRRNGLALGFSIVFAPPQESFCLLEYMAVDAAHRNAGLGRQLFLGTAENIFTEAGRIPMLLEVDSDREASADQTMRGRRQRFYRRLGCLRIAKLAYILPLPGEGAPPAMDLMVYFPGGARVVGKIQLLHWLKVIYHDVYSCPDGDPRITEMLKTVADPAELA
jgi:ribosomal protein S18 acetylase RimI-like enzyme